MNSDRNCCCRAESPEFVGIESNLYFLRKLIERKPVLLNVNACVTYQHFSANRCGR